jgi:NitT/TauT family transport system substrate-binding protein
MTIKRVLLLSLLLFSSASFAKDSFKVCWSIYVGWMPWGHAADQGIVDKWAKKYGIDIQVVQINDYIESINQYTAGQYDACAMTNMDALTIPAAGGVDSTALIVGHFSNGNDGVVLKDSDKLESIKGRSVNLVELSVSHYLLARALDSVGLKEKDIKVINTSDADMVAVYSTDSVNAAVTWNPLLMEVTRMPKSHLVFDSSKIPGEIIDLMVVNTKTLKENPKLGKALVGAWYEMMGLMAADDDQAKAAKTAMGMASGTDLAGYEAQLANTKMFFTPKAAVEFTQSEQLKKTMQQVAEFSFEHGLLGDGAPDAGFIGVETPAGTYGNKANLKLRFDPSFMQMAAEEKL